MKIKKIDVVENITSFTGLNVDAVRLFLIAYKLTLLNSVLDSQFDEEELDYIDTGLFLLDFSNYPKVLVKIADEFESQFSEAIKGRDFLSEAIVLKFNEDLLARYTNGGEDALFDSEPAISLETDSDE